METTTKTGIAVAVMAVLGSATAHADELEVADEAPRAKRHHKRMMLELAGMMAIGNRWYWRDNGQPNVVDWQLPWGAEAIEAKLGGTSAWRFDGNAYDINALGHPGFGALTHFLARENDYSIAEAFLISSLASGTWEVFLEWAEYGSLNDMLTTSTAGVPLGETAHQILHHADETVFSARGGVGTSGASTFGVVDVGGDLTTVPTSGDGAVGGGRAVRFAAEVQVDDGIRAIDGHARTNLAGYYAHRDGRSTFAALTTRFTYKNQRERDDQDWDLLHTVGIGPTVDVTLRRGELTMAVGADAFVDVALVKAQGYDTWRTAHPDAVIRNVMQGKDRPYYYGVGATVAPRVDLAYRRYRVGGSVSGTVIGSIDSADRDQEMLTANPHFTDTDARAQAWVGYERKGVSLLLEGRANRRAGSADQAHASTGGRTAMLTVGFSR